MTPQNRALRDFFSHPPKKTALLFPDFGQKAWNKTNLSRLPHAPMNVWHDGARIGRCNDLRANVSCCRHLSALHHCDYCLSLDSIYMLVKVFRDIIMLQRCLNDAIMFLVQKGARLRGMVPHTHSSCDSAYGCADLSHQHDWRVPPKKNMYT